ncbi:putative RESPONSE REGULATOR; LytTr family [Cupriavidus taiwanensis]|uniref:RESPONSE REGULATOR LytTr family n=2 Tax=Cupriavidus taiwanensis TaxID=164546 RepID=A0A976AV31_9BURK|nr:putative RESPONSE REGULATOR; LytTr family [Cupriavidus taiwanensis]SOZ53911.1 putative RESPONSE REGULATOR; LytTr family [Cupriavidus taiwanensis]SOZ56443.1 putative RESPONSE REGULATOR; LytTr family [Cupriavidus taiwanensis]SPA04724.1 putative RESPONSE REGULATOR; LytTr family [Cupriavidus taiwanensis]
MPVGLQRHEAANANAPTPTMTPTLLIADDEALLARVLESELAALWPEARVVSVVHDGVAALAAAREHQPRVAFLDIRMPGMSGMDVARELIEFDVPPLVVFVTAYDQFALEAFERAAVDYVLKPVQRERLEATVQRLKDRLAAPAEAENGDDEAAVAETDRLGQLLARLESLENATPGAAGAPQRQYLRFIKALVGQEVRIIPVDEVIYLEATDKYVNVVSGAGEALIRTSLRELTQQLDPERFWQVHRGTVVNISCVASAVNQSLGRLSLRLRDRPELLPVARQYAHLFKQM